MPSVNSVHAATRWTSRIVPLFLLALAVVAVYVVTERICVRILIPRQQQGTAIVVLVLLFFFLFLGLACYLRAFITISRDPGAVPLPPKVRRSRGSQQRHQRHESSVSLEEASINSANRLEQFWTKDIFECSEVGEPRWCDSCKNWKPDRAHHSSELGRCIRKMDHYCPWMGGMVSETSFKYFIQFNTYATCFTILCMSVSAYMLSLQVREGAALDPWIVVIVVLGGFFGLFTCTLATNGMRFACLNLTTVDAIDYKVNTYHLAIRVSRSIPPSSYYKLISLPPPEASNRGNGVNTFAVVETRPGEHPWDLGYYKNWESIMGNTVVDWFLPLRPSPESSYKSNVSEYPMGPLYETLRSRFNLGTLENRSEKR